MEAAATVGRTVEVTWLDLVEKGIGESDLVEKGSPSAGVKMEDVGSAMKVSRE